MRFRDPAAKEICISYMHIYVNNAARMWTYEYVSVCVYVWVHTQCAFAGHIIDGIAVVRVHVAAISEYLFILILATEARISQQGLAFSFRVFRVETTSTCANVYTHTHTHTTQCT